MLIFYDSECLMCDTFIHHIIKKDKNRVIKLCPLNSERSISILNERGISLDKKSIITINEYDKVFYESRAIISIYDELGCNKLSLFAMKMVPVQISDILYRVISFSRLNLSKLFKKKCEINSEVSIRIIK